MKFAESEVWKGLIRDGVSCLTRAQLDLIEGDLSTPARSILFLLLDNLDRDKRWVADQFQAITNAREALTHETEAKRIEAVGEAMRRAKLFEYVDETGRKFVMSPAGAFDIPPAARR